MKKQIIFILLILVGIGGQAQQLAFPGAEGFARYTTGGRNGTVYHVTNLNDSGAGSLRDAVSQSNRIVIFDVGGVIHITDRIVINKNVTIAGQTAPGEGITIYGNGIALNGDSGNDIIQYIRIRMGKNGDSGKDAVGISDGDDYMFNHVSVSWGRDGTFDINKNSSVGIDNVTIQDCIISQGINNSNHSTGGLMQTGHFSLIRTLFIDNKTRNPKGRGPHEYINSVVYNWGTNGYIHGDGGSAECNLLGNYFICGPSGSSNNYITGTSSTFHVYPVDNWLDGNKDGVLNGEELTVEDGGYKTDLIMDVPFDYPGVNSVLSAGDAVAHIILQAGASIARDEVDKFLIDELESYGIKGKIVNTEDDNGISGGVGIVFSGYKPADTDNDGMPDEWEDANGTNKIVNDAMILAPNEYANIENYIHSIIEPFPFLKYPINVGYSEKSTMSIGLKWDNLEELATQITIEYGKTGSGFTESKNVSGLATSSTIDGLQSNTSYDFRFQARNGSMISAYSSVYTIKTNAEATVPFPCENPSPSNSSTIQSYRFVPMSWTNSTSTMAGTLYYDVFFGKNSDAMELVSSSQLSKAYTTGELDQNTKYYWQVKTTNSLGTDEGVVWSFTTGNEITRTAFLYLPFDETAGTVATDLVNSATAIAESFTPQWQTGRIDNAIYFAGAPTASHLKMAHFNELFLDTKSFSISLWFKSPGTNSDTYLFHKGMHDDTNGGNGKWIGIQYKGTTLTFGIDDNSKKTIADISGASKWFNNSWHNLVCVRNVEVDKLQVYVDGVLENETTDGTGAIGETGDLIIGNRNGYFDNPYIGSLDELKVYDSALTDVEIRDNYLSITVGKNDLAFHEANIQLFPSPFSDELHVHFGDELTGNWKLELYSSTGSRVFTKKIQVNSNTLVTINNLNVIPKGIYNCILTNGKQQKVLKLIK